MARKNQPKQQQPVPVQQPQRLAPRPAASKEQQESRFKLTIIGKLCILLAAISIIAYSNTYKNGFVLDDVMVIKDNYIVPQGTKMIPDILGSLRLKGYANMSNEYRPLSLVMFATECEVAKAMSEGKNNPFNPKIHHLMNILVFAGCVVALFLFLHKLLGKKRIAVAFMASLIYALHPIHTEVVANIKSRDELLCFLFAFISLNAFADYMSSGAARKLIWGTLALFLAFLSKETVITFLAVVPVIFFFYLNDDRKKAIYITAGTVLATGVYLAIRAKIVADNGNINFPINFVDNMLVKSPSVASRLATELWILGDYIRLLFVPYPLSIDRSFNTIPFKTFANIRVILSLLVYIALAVVAVMRLIKKQKDPWAFAIIFFLATISLFSNIVIMLASTCAERFLFFCSVGSSLVMALAIEKWLIGKEGATIADIKINKVLAILVPVCLLYGGITYARNNDWIDSYTLYKADADKLPDNTRLNYYVASEMQKKCAAETDTIKAKQINEESMVYLRRSLSIYPENVDARAEMGAAYFRAHRFDSSEWYLKKALEINPTKSNALANLGTLYMTKQDIPNALIYYRQTNIVDPRNVVAQFNGGVCYYQMKKPDSAIMGFKNTIILQPDFYQYKSFQFIAIIYKELGKLDSAQMYAQQYQQIDPTFKL